MKTSGTHPKDQIKRPNRPMPYICPRKGNIASIPAPRHPMSTDKTSHEYWQMLVSGFNLISLMSKLQTEGQELPTDPHQSHLQEHSLSFSEYSAIDNDNHSLDNTSLDQHSFAATFTELSSTLLHQTKPKTRKSSFSHDLGLPFHLHRDKSYREHDSRLGRRSFISKASFESFLPKDSYSGFFLDMPDGDSDFEDESPQRPNLAHHLGVNYRIVLTHYASMKKEVLFVPYTTGTRQEYLLLNLQNYLDFNIEEMIKAQAGSGAVRAGQIFVTKPSGRLQYEALYFCKLPLVIRNVQFWKKIGSQICRGILTTMDEYQHKKIIFPHFRIFGLPEEFQIKGFLMAFMALIKKMQRENIEHPISEVMLTTSNKVHYQIWKEWLKDIVKSATTSLKEHREPDSLDTMDST